MHLCNMIEEPTYIKIVMTRKVLMIQQSKFKRVYDTRNPFCERY